MSALLRQNTLFIAESWIRVYEAIQNVDFRAYDHDNYIQALMGYISQHHPDKFNDWIASSELVMKMEVLAWLVQNISYRIDLNTRENFLATAERRNSLLLLAQNIAYKVSRVQAAEGDVKITSIMTDQPLVDLDGNDLRNRQIVWNDASQEGWFDQFVMVMNAAFGNRTPFGKPSATFTAQSIKLDQYVMNSISPDSGSYGFSVEGTTNTLPFDLYNANLDETTGAYTELTPGTRRAMRIFYKQDGNGFGSEDTGFFFPIKQGTLSSQEEIFETAKSVRTVILGSSNINNTDVFVQQIDDAGEVIEDWTKVDTVFGEGISFDPNRVFSRKTYEVDTLLNDQVRIRFGDGTFGEIPTGTFRFWVRTSDPNPTKIKSNAIQNKTVVLPYVGNDDQVYFLRITFSLTHDLENGAPSESSDDIKSRANKVFYTQNRIVSGQDMNNWFLTDEAIRKVHVINRTFSGHSRYSKLHDPTGLYENVREMGVDGRLFQKDTLTVTYVSADESRISNKFIMDQYVSPMVRKSDKTQLYYGRYNELVFPDAIEYRWKQNRIEGTQSLGNITRGGQPVPVGPTGVPILRYFGADSIFRVENINGPLAHVVRVLDNGTAPGSIILGGVVPDSAKMYSVFPPLRTKFTSSEESAIIRRLADHIDFGLTWSQSTQTWNIIEFNNLAVSGRFDIVNQGSTANLFMDNSWFIRFEYVADSINGDRWKLVDRGLAMHFESAKEVNFYYIGTDRVVDPDTGQIKHDTVQILGSNEHRDSLRRRGIEAVGTHPCELNAYEFTGDGTTKCFRTSETLNPEKIVVSVDGVYMVNNIDYTITHSVFGDSVCFFNPPPAPLNIVIRVTGDLLPASLRVFTYLVNQPNQSVFDLYQPNVIASNVLVFVDGVMQSPAFNYSVGALGDNASLIMSDPVKLGTRVVVYYAGNIDSQVFQLTSFEGDSAEQDFTIPTSSQTLDTVIVAIDGIIQHTDTYSLNPDVRGTAIHFYRAPDLGTNISLWSVTNPILAKIKRFDFSVDGTQTQFTLTGFSQLAQQNVIPISQGIYQTGPYTNQGIWNINGNVLSFADPPPIGDFSVIVFAGASGVLTNPRNRTLILDGSTGLGETGCHIRWIGNDVHMWVSGENLHDDGYTDSHGVQIRPSDLDNDGFADNPFIYRDLVMQDGFTDLVLWRRTQELGKDVWLPINGITKPRGSYGRSSTGKPKAGDTIESRVNHQDIHYDVTTNKWLVANRITMKWELSPKQTEFKKEIGRDNLTFIWHHYSPDTHRIDPSPGNVNDAYLLTTGYLQSYQNWIKNNGTPETEPAAPTPEALRVQFADHLQFKMLSDSIIFHTTRFKPLFGPQAVPELQAIFKVIPLPGSKIGDNQLRTNVLAVIDEYFDISKWDFGESFYFSELAAFVHTRLAATIQSIVIVPRSNGQAFGSLFQVRSHTDELFISAAQLEDVQVISSLTNDELQVGIFQS